MYKIIRLFKDSPSRHLIATSLTLEEAQAHCRNPETSSSTCTNEKGKERTARMGAWFDAYESI